MFHSSLHTSRPRPFLTAVLAALVCAAVAALAPTSAFASSTTFSYTGSSQTYTVPAGMNALQVSATGAAGGAGYYAGGVGSSVASTIPVTPGQTLFVYVGGNGAGGASAAGGFNGGGSASGYGGGASGGGASDIRTSQNDLTTRIIVAGGAGGGGSGYNTSAVGGNAGYPTAAAGSGNNSYGTGGGGGGQWVGGAGGYSNVGGRGANGAFGQGGRAGLYFYPPYYGGGGGGGGYYGGGGGGSFAAGGGGSDYVAPGAEGTSYAVASGAPQVTVTPVSSSLSISPNYQQYGPLASGTPSSPVTYTVTNKSLAPATISTATISGVNRADFVISNNTCTSGVILAPSTSCSLQVTFTPSGSGTEYAELDVTADTGEYGANLVGNPPPLISATPNPQDFGQVAEGQSRSAAVTVTNTRANSILTPGAASISNDAHAEFSITNDACKTSSLGNGQSCLITVKFAPNTVDTAESARLNIPNNDPSQFGNTAVTLQGTGQTPPAIAAAPNPEDFGNVQEGRPSSKSVTVTNNGETALTPGASSISNDTHAEFSITNDACKGASLAQGQSCGITVAFAPSTADTQETAQLNIPNNDPTQNGSTAVGLQGTGQTPPRIAAAPNPADFGGVPEKATQTQSITVTNNGEEPLTPNASSITGSGASQFSIASDGCNGQSLATGQSCVVKLSFSPSARGEQSASLSIPSNAPASPDQVALKGDGLAPGAPAVTPTSEAFGAEMLGQRSAPRTVTVTNTGDQVLTIGQASIAGANLNQFSIIAAHDTCSTQKLPAGASCTIQIQFAPYVAGSLAATLGIPNSSGSAMTVSLSGTGAAAVKLSAVKLSKHTITLCVGCKPPHVTLSFRLNEPASMHLLLERKVSGQWRPVGVQARSFSKGEHHIILGESVAGHLLTPGDYQLVLQATTAYSKSAKFAQLLFVDGLKSVAAPRFTG